MGDWRHDDTAGGPAPLGTGPGLQRGVPALPAGDTVGGRSGSLEGSVFERCHPALSPCGPGETLVLPNGRTPLASSQETVAGLAWLPPPGRLPPLTFSRSQAVLVAHCLTWRMVQTRLVSPTWAHGWQGSRQEETRGSARVMGHRAGAGAGRAPMDPSRGPKGPIQGHDSGKEGRPCRCLALWVLEPRALWSPGSEHQRGR